MILIKNKDRNVKVLKQSEVSSSLYRPKLAKNEKSLYKNAKKMKAYKLKEWITYVN